MRFAPTKCFVLSVTLRTTNSSHFSYRFCDTGLDEVKYYKYLGAYITSSLSWSLQCEEVKTKANKNFMCSPAEPFILRQGDQVAILR